MKFPGKWGRIPSPLPLMFIIFGTIAVILYGRGYRPDTQNPSLKTTGLLSVSSDPNGAQVFVNNELKTATKDSISIDPGWYDITVVKEGFIPWNKNLRVQGEVAISIDPFLFPKNPSLSPVTNTGITDPLLSPDGTKIAYIIPTDTSGTVATLNKTGIWVYDLVERPLGFNRDPRQVAISTSSLNLADAKLTWSPDSARLLVQTPTAARLYNVSRVDDFADVTTTLETLQTQWTSEKLLKDRQKLAAFKQPVIDLATSSANIISFSPDETKILYEATASATLPFVADTPLIGTNPTTEARTIEPHKLYVYDSREDKNYFVLDKKELPTINKASPSPSSKTQVKNVKEIPTPLEKIDDVSPVIHWFPTSRHLVVTFEGKIDIMEYDRTNWVTVYSGPLTDGFMAPWPNGSRIIIMTNLNAGVSSLPNLYTVNLR